MKKLLFGILCIFLMASMASTSSALPLVNGNFDTPDSNLPQVEGQWAVYDSIIGWTKGVGTSGIEIQYNTVVGAYSPNYYVELDSHGGDDTNSSMFQDVFLTAGTYELSFWYHARTNNDDDDNGIAAFIGDTFINAVSKKTNEQLAVWEEINWTFEVGVDDTYALILTAWGDDNTLGGFVDSVSLNPVPEPATMMLLGLGLLSLAGISRKKS